MVLRKQENAEKEALRLLFCLRSLTLGKSLVVAALAFFALTQSAESVFAQSAQSEFAQSAQPELAQEAQSQDIYRCGKVLTNQPERTQKPRRCVRLSADNNMTIRGTKVYRQNPALTEGQGLAGQTKTAAGGSAPTVIAYTKRSLAHQAKRKAAASSHPAAQADPNQEAGGGMRAGLPPPLAQLDPSLPPPPKPLPQTGTSTAPPTGSSTAPHTDPKFAPKLVPSSAATTQAN